MTYHHQFYHIVFSVLMSFYQCIHIVLAIPPMHVATFCFKLGFIYRGFQQANELHIYITSNSAPCGSGRQEQYLSKFMDG